MSKTDDDTTIQELKNLVTKFRDDRGWEKHHSPKNLAMSIAIEAAEIMEHFQWDSFSATDKKAVAAELADVVCYCLSLAEVLNIDIGTAVRAKVAHNAKKYPVALFNAERTGTKDYNHIKKTYRKEKA